MCVERIRVMDAGWWGDAWLDIKGRRWRAGRDTSAAMGGDDRSEEAVGEWTSG